MTTLFETVYRRKYPGAGAGWQHQFGIAVERVADFMARGVLAMSDRGRGHESGHPLRFFEGDR